MHNTKLLFLSLSSSHSHTLSLYLGVSYSQRLYLFLPFNLLSFCRPLFLLSLHRCPLQSFSSSYGLHFSLYVSLTIPTLSLSLSFPHSFSFYLSTVFLSPSSPSFFLSTSTKLFSIWSGQIQCMHCFRTIAKSYGFENYLFKWLNF